MNPGLIICFALACGIVFAGVETGVMSIDVCAKASCLHLGSWHP